MIIHEYQIPLNQVEALFNEYYPHIIHIVKILRCIFKRLMIISTNARFDADSGGYIIDAYIVKSDNAFLEGAKYPCNANNILHINRINTVNEILYFSSNEDDFISLSPYLLYNICPLCEHPRMLINDSEGDYIDIQIGHRVNLIHC